LTHAGEGVERGDLADVLELLGDLLSGVGLALSGGRAHLLADVLLGAVVSAEVVVGGLAGVEALGPLLVGLLAEGGVDVQRLGHIIVLLLHVELISLVVSSEGDDLALTESVVSVSLGIASVSVKS